MNWIRVELIEETGELTVRQFGSAEYGPEGKERDVTVTHDVVVSPEHGADLRKALKELIQANRGPVNKQLRRAKAAAELVAETNDEFDDGAAGAD
jgi:hypothetical protein